MKLRKMKFTGHVACMGEMKNTYNILVGNLKGKRRLRRPRSRKWEGNMRMDLGEIGWKVVDWIHLVQDRDHWWTLVNTGMTLWVP
jgi:hypothetical protein